MNHPRTPPDEQARLLALHSCGILDTPPDPMFDELTRLAADIYATPMAWLSFIDVDRQWLKSAVGLSLRETPLNVAFCAHAILGDDVMVVTDAMADERFRESPLVLTGPRIRFYAGAPIVTAAGHHLGALCVADTKPRDIEPLELTALRLLASQAARNIELHRHTRLAAERLDQIIEAAPDGIMLVREDGTIALANARLEEMFGYGPGTLMGIPVETLIPVRSRVVHVEHRARYLRNPRARPMGKGLHLTGLRRDGSEVPLEVSLSPLRSDGGGRVVAIARDITDRVQSEDALHRSEARFRGLVEHAPLGIYRSTLHGELLMVNPALVEMLGYASPAELLGVNALALYADPEERPTLLHRLHGAESIPRTDVTWLRKDGSKILVRLIGRSLPGDEDGSLHFEMIASDVTHEHRLEEQLRQAQKLEAIGQLTGGLAHDFNNLLAVVLVNADMALQDLERGAYGEMRLALDDIARAARSGADLIRGLLGFARRSTLQMKVHDPRTLTAEAAAILRRTLPETIEFLVDTAESVSPVEVDPTAFQQIILNLATNARDAMPKGGTLRIELANKTVDPGFVRDHPWFHEGRFVCVTVSDTGTGMDAATKARIFDPFFTTKPPGKGTGLGLAMVFGLVKQLGGFIHVYSEVGHGTTFRVYLPACSGDADPTRVDAAPVPDAGARTILVVEDDEHVRATLVRGLGRLGHRVLVAANGEEAILLFRDHEAEIELVFSDFNMPKMGGLDLYRVLREGGSAVPFILASGYGARQVAERTSLPPDVQVVAKPWGIAELAAAIAAALR